MSPSVNKDLHLKLEDGFQYAFIVDIFSSIVCPSAPVKYILTKQDRLARLLTKPEALCNFII